MKLTVWSNKDLRKWYAKLNEQFFAGFLPEDMPVRYGNLNGEDANGTYSQDSGITVSRHLRYVGQLQAVVLIHEMVHVELEMLGYVGYPADGGHGPRFQKRLIELFEAGAFDNIL